jgi:hypothetical protein
MLDLLDDSGAQVRQEYVVPNKNQCAGCHARNDKLHFLGLTTAQLNRAGEEGRNQLEAWGEQGLFATPLGAPQALPAYPDPFAEGDLEQRARGYLHGNCGHCHRPGGAAGLTGLFLLASVTDPYRYGVCKGPVAAGSGTGGRHYDIQPGNAAASIIPYRMASVEPAIKMPEIPNLLPDTRGVALVSDWIDSMEPVDCLDFISTDGSAEGSGDGSAEGSGAAAP